MHRWLYIIIGIICTACNPNWKEIKQWEQLVEQAEQIERSAPSDAHALLDSVKYPSLLSDKWLTRYCVLACRLADSIATPLPYEEDLDRALYYLEEHGEPIEQARMGFYWGRALQDKELYRPALNAFKEAEVRSREAEDLHLTARICQQIGELYDYQADYASARDWMEESLKLFKQTSDKQRIGLSCYLLGREYASLDSFDIAMECMMKADSIIWPTKDSTNIAIIYNGMGNIYQLQGKRKEAKFYFYQSMAFRPNDCSPTCFALGSLYLEEDSITKAEYYLNEALKPTSNSDTHEELLYHFYKLERKKGNMELAMDYMEKYQISWEKYMIELRHTNLAEANASFDRRQMMEKNDRLQKEKAQRDNMLMWGGIFFLLVVIILLYWIKHKNDQLHHLVGEVLKLRSRLQEKEAEKQYLSSQLEEHQQKYEQAIREAAEQGERSHEMQQFVEKYEQFQQKLENSQKEISDLHQQIQEKNRQLWVGSSIYKKVMKLAAKAVPGNDKYILPEKDKAAVNSTLDWIYPNLKAEFIHYGITPTEMEFCYFSFFELSNSVEAILLNRDIGTVEKNHTRIRRKLGFPKDKGPISHFFIK